MNYYNNMTLDELQKELLIMQLHKIELECQKLELEIDSSRQNS